MFKRFIIWLSRYYLDVCEGCGSLYVAVEGNITDDDVSLCPHCWNSCVNDSDFKMIDEQNDAIVTNY